MRRLLKNILNSLVHIINWMGDPAVIGALICLLLFYLQGDERILYIYTIIYFVYLLVEIKASSTKRFMKTGLLIFVLRAIFLIILLMPAIIKLPAIYLYFTIYIIYAFEKNSASILNYFLVGAHNFSASLLRFYLQLLIVLLNIILFSLAISPVITEYYEKYGDKKMLLDVSFGVYFVVLMAILVLWTIISLGLSLIRSALAIEVERENIVRIVLKFVGTLIIFFVLPDFMFSLLYLIAFLLSGQNDIAFWKMFLFAFSLHHQIVFSDSLLSYQDKVLQHPLLTMVEIFHVTSNKIIEITILSTIIISTFSDKVRGYLRGRRPNKDDSNLS